MSEPYRVPRLWPGETVVCIGGGPSLTPEDVNYCRGRARVIAVNDAYRLAPWADVLYACDAKFWTFHKGVPDFQGLKFAIEPPAARWPNVIILKNLGLTGLSTDPTGVRTGKNSGYQSVNLAVLLGASRIVLLGYDMKSGPNGQQHWFPKDGVHPTVSPYHLFREYYQTIRTPLKNLGIDVLNASRDTALKWFPRVSLEQALAPVSSDVEVETASGVSLEVLSRRGERVTADGAPPL